MRESFLNKKLGARLIKGLLILSFVGIFFVGGIFVVKPPKEALAGCDPCTQCPQYDCTLTEQIIPIIFDAYIPQVNNHTTQAFDEHRDWLVNEFFEQHVLPALQMMTEQLSAVAMHQVAAIGMFIDAKHQLETQRLFQELQNQAHKDYQPSEDFCWFGTNVRSMAASEQIGRFNAMAMNARQLSRHLANANMGGANQEDEDKLSRWQKFTSDYCDPQDNNWDPAEPGSGLQLACGAGGGNTGRINIDIDYTRMIDEPRTLDVAFTDGNAPTNDEEDVFALGNNLYGHKVLTRDITETYLKNREYQHLYLGLRSVAAKRSVAENSYNSIVGLKSAGTSDGTAGGGSQTYAFLGAIMTELGVPAGEVYQIIGPTPSYYAQLEMLAKKIYQNPDFYSNLYDKPANVARKGVALKAIDLMLDRAIYESQLRQEMAMSVLLSSRLRGNFRDVNKDLPGAGGN